jgi:capsular exopolysaccharide synthesis family protein
MFAEACRSLRSSLLFVDRDGPPPKSILITSAVPSEGKSTISGNLAIALAFTSSRTLLIDADLRRGTLHKYLEMENKSGLSEVITGDVKFERAVQHSSVENLDFLSCGAYPERPGELLMSSRMEELYKYVNEAYDYIIFDTAPVLATDDTTSFASRIDVVIFAVRAAFTPARQVKSSVERLAQRGIDIDGFVLNFVDTKGADYYYYSKYQNYYYAPQTERTGGATAP